MPVKGSLALDVPALLFVAAGVSGCSAPNTPDVAFGVVFAGLAAAAA